MSVLASTFHFAPRRTQRAIPQPGLIRRLFAGLLQSRQRRAEQDIAIRLGLTGGRLTDEIERRMNERLLSGSGFQG